MFECFEFEDAVLEQCSPGLIACEFDDFSTTSTTLSPDQKIAAGLETSTTTLPAQKEQEASLDDAPEEKKSNAWVAAVVVILLLLIAGGAYHMFVHKPKQQLADGDGGNMRGVENSIYDLSQNKANPIADSAETLYFDTAPAAGPKKSSNTIVNAAFQPNLDTTYDTVAAVGDGSASGQYVDGNGAYVDAGTLGNVHEYEYQDQMEGGAAAENTYDPAAGGESFDDFNYDTYADLPVDVGNAGGEILYDAMPTEALGEASYGGLDVDGFESSDEDV